MNPVLAHLKSWWMAHLTLIGAIVTFLSPSVQAYIAGHKGSSVAVGAIWAYILKVSKSPLAAAVILLALAISTGSPVIAQTPAAAPQPVFSVSTQAVAVRIGGTTNPGTDAIGSLNLTKNVQLQSDNILAPGNNLQAYLGGIKYYAPLLGKPLAKTNLANIKPYIHGAVGVVRNVPPNGVDTQHYSALAGAGFDYQVNGTLSFGPRVEYFNAAGFGPSPHGAAVSANLTIVLGSK